MSDRLLAGRYLLGPQLGEGAVGVVYAAEDQVTGAAVALKRALSPGLRLRREEVALQRAALPGVVRLLDDGIDEGLAFTVMERVDGAPFPGPFVEGLRVALPLQHLLETLGALHGLGVYHFDLKPQHALTEVDGSVRLIDFGLASGPGVEARPVAPLSAGTLRWAAPERILAQEADGRADLYAVGLMLWEALVGEGPHGPLDGPRLRAARVRQAPPSIGARLPDLPGDWVRAIDALVARSPAERPATAWAVLDALGLRRPALAPRMALASAADLLPWIAGPARSFHRREDAAEALWARTGGHPAAVAAELAAWERQGIARITAAGAVSVTPGGLAHLRAGGWTYPEGPPAPALSDDLQAVLERVWLSWPAADPADLGRALGWPLQRLSAAIDALGPALLRLPGGGLRPMQVPRLSSSQATLHRELAAAARSPAARLAHDLRGHAPVAATALDLADEAHRAGQIDAERELLHLALDDARGRGESDLERRALIRLARWALNEGSQAALTLARGALHRPGGQELPALEAILDAAVAALRRQGALALELAPPLGDPDPELADLCRRVRTLAASAVDDATFYATLDAVRAEVQARGGAVDQAWLASWEGRARYRQGDFVGAAASQEALAAQLPASEPLRRVVALSYAASAWLEAGQLAACRRAAAESGALARQCRSEHWEGRARWLERAATYRAEVAAAPDIERVDEVALIEVPSLLGMVALTEAAFAWRAGDRALTEPLAGRALDAFRAAQLPAGQQLAQALGLRVTGGAVDALLTAAAAAQIPDVDWQVLALVAPLSRDAAWIDLAKARAAAAPHPARRRELLSPAEAMGGDL